MSTEIPTDLRYTKDHEWARKDGDVVVVGITAHAVEQLGDITLVTLPEAGTVVTAGQSFGDVDSVKAVSELFAPLTGEVVERNKALDTSPEKVNEDPYGDGWMIKLRPADPKELEGLMTPEQYTKLTAG
ncbi:MAG TPA: glycine cleavage system protein GcvH [Nannocystaceae bacterium]|nr:glycine cleavage system protein GcvH [Nannocystaceae bacterium]